MTIQDQITNYRGELFGFISSSTASALKFNELFSKGIEVAIFAFITGMVGAFAAHLYKIIINKLSKKK